MQFIKREYQIRKLSQCFWMHCQQSEVQIGATQQIRYIEEMDSLLTSQWSELALIPHPSHTIQWGHSMINSSGLSFFSQEDEDPMLVIAGRYGLTPYFKARLASRGIPRSGDAIQALMVRLICWLMSSDSHELRIQHIVIVDILLKTSMSSDGVNLAMTRRRSHMSSSGSVDKSSLWDLSPWEVLIYLRPLKPTRLSFFTTVLSSSSSFSVSVEVDIFDH